MSQSNGRITLRVQSCHKVTIPIEVFAKVMSATVAVVYDADYAMPVYGHEYN